MATEYNLNKENCVEYLVNNCLSVHLAIPDVVAGEFAKTFKFWINIVLSN